MNELYALKSFEGTEAYAGKTLYSMAWEDQLAHPPDKRALGMMNRAIKSGVVWNNATWQLPEWLDMMGSATLTGTPQAYAAVPLIARAVRLCCDALSGIPYHLEDESGTIIEDWPFPTSLEDLLWNCEASMLLFGHHEWLKISADSGLPDGRIDKHIQDVDWLHGRFSIPWYDPGGRQVLFSYTHPGEAGNYAYDVHDCAGSEIVYFREFNPVHKYLPGPGAAMTALSNAGLTHYLTVFASAFFEGGAMPVTFVSTEGTPPDEPEQKRIESQIKQMMTNVRNAWRVLWVKNKVNAQVITPTFDKLAMMDLFERAQQEVAKAFDIPQTLLAEATNKATQGEDDQRFYTDKVIPRAKKRCAQINRELFGGTGLQLVFDYEELPVMQANESERGKSFSLITSALAQPISPQRLQVAMDIVGYSLSDDQKAQLFGNPDEPIVPAGEPAVPAAEAQPNLDHQAAQKTVLKKWEWKALSALRYGKDPDKDAPFTTDLISEAEQAALRARLRGCKTDDEVKAAFRAVKFGAPAKSIMVKPGEPTRHILALEAHTAAINQQNAAIRDAIKALEGAK